MGKVQRTAVGGTEQNSEGWRKSDSDVRVEIPFLWSQDSHQQDVLYQTEEDHEAVVAWPIMDVGVRELVGRLGRGQKSVGGSRGPPEVRG